MGKEPGIVLLMVFVVTLIIVFSISSFVDRKKHGVTTGKRKNDETTNSASAIDSEQEGKGKTVPKQITTMKNLGVLLLIIGGIWALIAFNMDITVRTGEQFIGSLYIPSTTVNNIGLMDERRNHLMMSALLIVVGIILFAFGNRQQTDNGQSKRTDTLLTLIDDTKKCPYCAETIKTEAIICRFCQRDLRPVNLEREKPMKENKKERHV